MSIKLHDYFPNPEETFTYEELEKIFLEAIELNKIIEENEKMNNDEKRILDDKENFIIVEFKDKIAEGYEISMIALFNKTRISEEEVKKIILEKGENPNVIIMHKDQFRNVFLKKENV